MELHLYPLYTPSWQRSTLHVFHVRQKRCIRLNNTVVITQHKLQQQYKRKIKRCQNLIWSNFHLYKCRINPIRDKNMNNILRISPSTFSPGRRRMTIILSRYVPYACAQFSLSTTVVAFIHSFISYTTDLIQMWN